MNPDLRRSVLIGLAGVIVLTAFLAFALVLQGWLHMRAEIERAALEQSVPPAADPARYLTPGENLAVASSNLQSRLNQAARAAGLTASRVQIMPQDASDPLALRLEFQAQGSLDDLSQLLHTLESGLPALIVENVQLTRIRQTDDLLLTATIQARREPGADS